MSKYQDFEPRSAARVHKEPMRKACELSEEFGITPQKLAKMLQFDPTAPKGQTTNGKRPLRYPLQTTRKWWAHRNRGAEQLYVRVNRSARMWAVTDADGSVIFGYRKYDDETRAIAAARAECARFSTVEPIVYVPPLGAIR